MTNLSKVDDPDRYYNWYHGYTEIEYPYYYKKYNRLMYKVSTSAISGNISTQYFGDNKIRIAKEYFVSFDKHNKNNQKC